MKLLIHQPYNRNHYYYLIFSFIFFVLRHQILIVLGSVFSILYTAAKAILFGLALVVILGTLSPCLRLCISFFGYQLRMSPAMASGKPDGHVSRGPMSTLSTAGGNTPAPILTDKDHETRTSIVTLSSTSTAPAPSTYGLIANLLSAASTHFPRALAPTIPPATSDTALTPTTISTSATMATSITQSDGGTRNSMRTTSDPLTQTSSTDTLGQRRRDAAGRTIATTSGTTKSNVDENSTRTILHASVTTPPQPQAVETSPPISAPTSSDNTTTSIRTPTTNAIKDNAGTGTSTTLMPTTNPLLGTSTPMSATTANDNGLFGLTPVSKNVNSGIIAKEVQIDTWDSTIIDDSFNKTVYCNGNADRAAGAFSGVFYVYIHDIAEDMHSRMVIIFASRTVADEWWHAVSTSDIPILKGNITRITPQFYTHDTRQWNIDNFFTEPRIHKIAERFRGRMFLDLENDRSGRGITILPTQSTVDHASGDWFSVRSKANADHYWYYDEAVGCITVSDTRRTSFKISATNMHNGAIMIGVDTVTLTVQHHGSVVPRSNRLSGATVLGVTVRQSEAFIFKFDDLDKGRFVPGKDEPFPLYYVPQGRVSAGWELVL